MCDDKKKKTTSHLERQYEFFSKHLEYHDSNVFKTLSIYFVFAGVFLVKIDRFYCAKIAALAIVVVVGLAFTIVLYRTSRLVNEFKGRINEIDQKLKTEETISEYYKGIGCAWQRTSIVGVASVAILSSVLIYHLITTEKPADCDQSSEVLESQTPHSSSFSTKSSASLAEAKSSKAERMRQE